MLKEFKEFAIKGNVIDMAIGIVIGTAFGKIVTSLVSDIIMPPIGVLLSNVSFSDLYLNLSNKHYASLSEAQAAGAPTINYGLFLDTSFNFLIIAFVIFLLIKQVNRLKKNDAEQAIKEPSTKECPLCLSSIPAKALRCAHCATDLPRN